MGVGTDFADKQKAVDAYGQSALGALLKWTAHVGIPAAFAIIMLLQTNVKLDRLIEAVTRLSVTIEAKK